MITAYRRFPVRKAFPCIFRQGMLFVVDRSAVDSIGPISMP